MGAEELSPLDPWSPSCLQILWLLTVEEGKTGSEGELKGAEELRGLEEHGFC